MWPFTPRRIRIDYDFLSDFMQERARQAPYFIVFDEIADRWHVHRFTHLGQPYEVWRNMT